MREKIKKKKKAAFLGASYLKERFLLFCCFETRSHYVAQAVLELTVVRLVWNSGQSCLFCLPRAVNIGAY